MAKSKFLKKLAACFTAGAVIASTIGIIPVRADSYKIVTLGADLSEEQKQTILAYFNVSEGDAQIITVTNEDEHRLLDGQFTAEEIGTHTYSCAMINPTSSGGVQAKTANMNRVTADTIIGQLSTSGVANCEVLTSAPFMVSGTGALTGVLMAYETASGSSLDPEKKETAVVETKTTNEIADDVGQDGATLVVNDIKIRIVRDKEEPTSAVDNTLSDLEDQLAQLSASAGVSGTIDEAGRESLYAYGERVQEMNYDYDSMKVTLQRVTNNIAERNGITDPIQETFEDLSAEDVLPENSILRETNDDVMGEEANITATNEEALAPAEEEEEEPAEPAPAEMPKASESEPAVTGISLTKVMDIPDARGFVSGTALIRVKDTAGSGSYGLSDLNGNMITDYKYSDYFGHRKGLIVVTDKDDYNLEGVITSGGSEVAPVKYNDAKIFGTNWAGGITLKSATAENYDYSGGGKYYLIDAVDIYYTDGGPGTLVGTLSRSEFYDAEADGPYLNVENRERAVTTYDSSFSFLVRNPENIHDFTGLVQDEGVSAGYDSEARKYALYDKDGNAITPPFADYIYTPYDDAAKFSINSEDGETTKYGLVSISGEELLPAVFDDIDYSQSGPMNENYENIRFSIGGYYRIAQDGKTGYATAGGTVTCQPAYSSDALDERGAVAYYQNPDGTFRVIAADGVETDLPREYTGIYPVNYADGFLLDAEGENDTLLDWHGNVLHSGAYDYQVSGDGNYLIAVYSSSEDTAAELFKIEYLTDGSSPEPASGQEQPSETEAPGEEGAPAEASAAAGSGEDVTLTKTGEISEAFPLTGSSLLALKNPDGSNSYALAGLDGNPLTGYEFKEYFTVAFDILIQAETLSGAPCVLSSDGTEVIPPGYPAVDIFGSKWAAGIRIKEADAENYDYRSSDSKYYLIDTVDLYYIDNSTASLVSTLTRSDFMDARGKGDYLNLTNRQDNAVRTYDSSFNVVKMADSLYDFDGLFADSYHSEYVAESRLYALYNGLGEPVTEPFADSLSIITADGAMFGIDPEEGERRYGLISLDGEEILPAAFEDIRCDYSGPKSPEGDVNRFDFHGYYRIKEDENLGYAVRGGAITCEPRYKTEALSIVGASASYQNPDGSYLLIAADGAETSLPREYTSLNSLAHASGFILNAEKEEGCDLIDWHGNVLAADVIASRTKVTGDGRYLCAFRSDHVLEIFEIGYPEPEESTASVTEAGTAPEEADTADMPAATNEPAENGEIPEETGEPAGNDEPAEETGEPAENDDTEKIKTVLQNTIAAITDIDFTEKKDDISKILQQEIDLVSPISPEAAAEITSAKELVDSGLADAETVTAYLEKAISLL